jgi:Tfp pilus assembly protein FimT
MGKFFSRNKHAFTLMDLVMGLACLAIISVLTLPLLARRSGCSGGMSCVNNLKQVGLSFRTWALDNGDKYPMQMSTNDGGTREWVGTGSVFKHFLVMSNELSTPKILFCPQENDRRRTAATTFANTVPVGAAQQVPFTNDNNISYFVGVDAPYLAFQVADRRQKSARRWCVGPRSSAKFMDQQRSRMDQTPA